MRIGAVYPQIELGGDPDAVRRIASPWGLGFDHLLGSTTSSEPATPTASRSCGGRTPSAIRSTTRS